MSAGLFELLSAMGGVVVFGGGLMALSVKAERREMERWRAVNEAARVAERARIDSMSDVEKVAYFAVKAPCGATALFGFLSMLILIQQRQKAQSLGFGGGVHKAPNMQKAAPANEPEHTKGDLFGAVDLASNGQGDSGGKASSQNEANKNGF